MSDINSIFSLMEITRLEQKLQNTLSLYITSSGKVKAEYQDDWDDLDIKTRSWTMCMSINRDVSHILVPSESGVQLLVLKTTHDSVIVKTWNLEAPSRRGAKGKSNKENFKTWIGRITRSFSWRNFCSELRLGGVREPFIWS